MLHLDFGFRISDFGFAAALLLDVFSDHEPIQIRTNPKSKI